MVNEFLLPDIGEGLTEAEVVSWLVDVGSNVALDEPLVELETDKAVVEIPSPFAGVVLHHGAGVGDTIEVGAILAVIGEAGEAWSTSASSSSEESVVAATAAAAAPLVGTLSEEAETLTRSGTVQALPIVRKLAREHGIDLATIEGTGPGGRVLRADIEHLLEGGEDPPVVADTLPPSETDATPATATTDGRRMSPLRRSIADHMTRSWAEIPHVTTFDDVRVDRLLTTRKALAARHDLSVSIEALVTAAVLPVLDEFPDFNASLDGDAVVHHADRHVGLAVDSRDGLLVATIRAAQGLSFLELVRTVNELVAGAADRKLGPDQLGGQTFTVSNIGAVGGGHGTPLVPHGTTAILSVGRAAQQPVVDHDELAIGMVMPLSLSYDHRVIDGGQGRRFMTRLMENLQEPALFLA